MHKATNYAKERFLSQKRSNLWLAGPDLNRQVPNEKRENAHSFVFLIITLCSRKLDLRQTARVSVGYRIRDLFLVKYLTKAF